MDMVIQAGPLLADIPGQAPAAGPDLVELVNQIDGILDRARAGVGAVILRLILFEPPGKKHPRKVLSHRHLDVRVCLVIHEHGVVLGPVLLDKVALQHQGLQLRIRDNVLKAGDVRDHLLDLHALIPAGLEILPHPVLQGDSLSHVDDSVLLIVHQVDPRLRRKLFQFFFYVKHDLNPFPSSV